MAQSDSSEMIALLTKHQPALFAFLRTMLPNAADAEDALQETNIALWKNIDSFQPGSNFYAFATKVAYRKALDHGRKDKKLGGLIFNSELIERISEHLREESGNLASMREDNLGSCISSLTAPDRQLIKLRYFQQRTIREIVGLTGKTETNLQYHFGRIRGLLRSCIESKLPGISER